MQLARDVSVALQVVRAEHVTETSPRNQVEENKAAGHRRRRRRCRRRRASSPPRSATQTIRDAHGAGARAGAGAGAPSRAWLVHSSAVEGVGRAVAELGRQRVDVLC